MPRLRATLPLLGLLIGCAGPPAADEGSPTATATPTPVVEASRSFLFVGTEASGRSHLMISNQTGTTQTDLSALAGALQEGERLVSTAELCPWPVPSPNGMKVVVSAERLDDTGGAIRSLREIDRIEGTWREIEVPAGRLTRALYNPSGEHLLLEVRGEEATQLYVANGGVTSPLKASGSLATLGFFPREPSRVLLSESTPEGHRLVSLDLETQALVPLTAPLPMDIVAAQVSPDGQQLLFQGWTGGSDCSDLFVVDLSSEAAAPRPLQLSLSVWALLQPAPQDEDGTPLPPPTPTDPEPPGPDDGGGDPQCLPISSPAWAPDESGLISFLATLEGESPRSDVFLARADGTAISSPTLALGVPADSGVGLPPQWSPDGRSLLVTFNATTSDVGSATLQLVDPTGASPALPLTSSSDPAPTLAHFASDGEAVLYLSTHKERNTPGPISEVRVIDLSSGGRGAVALDSQLTPTWPLWVEFNTLLY